MDSVVDPQIQVKDLVVRDGWDVDRMQDLIDQLAREVMESVGRLKDAKDVLIWLPDKNRILLDKIGFDFIRVRLPIFEWAKWIWNKWLPKKFALCIWKAYFNCLSVDEQVRKLGILMVSYCNCCAVGREKDLDHVLNRVGVRKGGVEGGVH